MPVCNLPNHKIVQGRDGPYCWTCSYDAEVLGPIRANARQVAGNHYMNGEGLQHWDVVHLFNLDYFQGNITKYIFRWRKKGGIADLHKAKHYLEKYIELAEKGETSNPKEK